MSARQRRRCSEYKNLRFAWFLRKALERVRAVRAHHEKKLEQNLVGIREARIRNVPQMSVAVLATDLAKLAGPIRQNTGKASVRQVSVGGAAAAVEPSADCPPAIDTILAGRIQAEGVLRLEDVERR